MLGREALRFQGICLPDSHLDQFTEALMLDLAGNAFNTPSCAACMLTLLWTFAVLTNNTQAEPVQIPRADFKKRSATSMDADTGKTSRPRVHCEPAAALDSAMLDLSDFDALEEFFLPPLGGA